MTIEATPEQEKIFPLGWRGDTPWVKPSQQEAEAKCDAWLVDPAEQFDTIQIALRKHVDTYFKENMNKIDERRVYKAWTEAEALFRSDTEHDLPKSWGGFYVHTIVDEISVDRIIILDHNPRPSNIYLLPGQVPDWELSSEQILCQAIDYLGQYGIESLSDLNFMLSNLKTSNVDHMNFFRSFRPWHQAAWGCTTPDLPKPQE